MSSPQLWRSCHVEPLIGFLSATCRLNLPRHSMTEYGKWGWSSVSSRGNRTLNKALNQALKLQAVKAAAEPPRRLREVTGALAGASQLLERRRDGKPVCWQGRSPANFAKTADRGHGKRETRKWEKNKAGVNWVTPASRTLSSRFTLGQRPSDQDKMREGGNGKSNGAPWGEGLAKVLSVTN